MKTFKTILLAVLMVSCYSLAFAQPVLPTCPGHSRCADGGGGVDPIITHWPMHGNIPNKSIVFKWEPVQEAEVYTFTLFDAEANTLFTKKTKSLGVVLDLPSLNLTEGKEFVITLNSDNDRRSNPHRFILKSVNEYKNDLLALDSNMEFRKLGGANKAIKKSNFLHKKGWNLASVKALNIETDNLEDMMKIVSHFDALKLKLDPLPE